MTGFVIESLLQENVTELRCICEAYG